MINQRQRSQRRVGPLTVSAQRLLLFRREPLTVQRTCTSDHRTTQAPDAQHSTTLTAKPPMDVDLGRVVIARPAATTERASMSSPTRATGARTAASAAW